MPRNIRDAASSPLLPFTVATFLPAKVLFTIFVLSIINPAPVWERSIVMSVSACVSVCLRASAARKHIRPIFLCRHCDRPTLCSPGFMYTFAQDGPYGGLSIAL